MKYSHQDKVLPELAERSKRDIEAVNTYMNSVKGTIITVQRLRSGQPRPYADSVDEALIFCHQPNVMTTNAPLVRSITRKDAEVLARMFVGSWAEKPGFLESRLELLEPAPNPCGLEEYARQGDAEPRSSCWRVIIRHPYCD